MDHGLTIPPNMNKAEWETIVNKNIEVATHVEPTHAMRTSAHEIEILTKFFSGRVPTFLRVGEKGKSDSVRVRLEERKIYFKWDSLMIFIERVFSNKDVDSVRYFIDDKQNCEYYRQGRGHRDWWRYTYAISFDKLDEYDVESWLVSGGVQKEEEE
jgi:hypothetical protein